MAADRFIATVRPEAWQNNYAIPVDTPGITDWDCTAAVESQGLAPAIREAMGEEGEWLDNDDQLALDPAGPAWLRKWPGPFTITVRIGRAN